MEKQLIYLPKELRKRTKVQAVKRENSISEFCQKALEHYISFLEKNKETASA